MQDESAYFDIIINNNPDLICRYSLDKKIKFINKTIEKISGYPPEFYIGKSISDFDYPILFINEFKRGFDQCVEQGIPSQVEIYVAGGRLKDYFVSIDFIPIYDEKQDAKPLIGVFSITRDITSQKKLELDQQQKIEEQRMLSQRIVSKANKLQNFAYIVSHNLRSPVASLVGLLNLYDETHNSDEQKEIIGMFKTSVDRLNQTVLDLTEAIKINQNINVKLEKLSFDDTLRRVEESIALLILDTHAQIEQDFRECESLMYHKVYLESIFLNLLTNSIKYRHPDRAPLIAFKTKMTTTGIILTCQDNGVGIDLNQHGNKIFGLNKTFHGNQDARGVGLFITRSQIEALNGRISVASEVGQGTIFTIEFSQQNLL